MGLAAALDLEKPIAESQGIKYAAGISHTAPGARTTVYLIFSTTPPGKYCGKQGLLEFETVAQAEPSLHPRILSAALCPPRNLLFILPGATPQH